jgi:hypothetical protein
MTATPTKKQTQEAQTAYQGIDARAKQLVQTFSDRLYKSSGVILLPDERANLTELVVLHSSIEWQKATEYAVSLNKRVCVGGRA